MNQFSRSNLAALLLGSSLLLAPGLLLRGATFELQTATIEDISKAFDAGALTSEKLVQLYLARISAYDKQGPNINAIITLNTEAIQTARALDAERKTKGPRSKLHGVPVVLKDLFDTVDMPTSAGFDAEDLLTIASPGNTPKESYTTFLAKDGLRGARIGVLRDFFRKGPMHEEGVAFIDSAITEMKQAGAIIVDKLATGVDVFPLLDGADATAGGRVNYFEAQFSYNLYFRRLGPNAPIHNMDELIAHGPLVKSNIVKAYAEFRSLMHNVDYLARIDTQETMREAVLELMKKFRLDAVVFPFRSIPPNRHLDPYPESDNSFSSVSGLPAVVLPAGYAKANNGPIAIEFLGAPYSEPTLFKLAYAFEQTARRRKLPPSTPALPGERFDY